MKLLNRLPIPLRWQKRIPGLAPPRHRPQPASRTAQGVTGVERKRTTLARSTRGWSRSILWSLVGLSGFSAVYGSIARIESSIVVQGKLEPIGGILKLSAPLNGLVEQVMVKDGQRVEAGAVLVVLRDEAGSKQLKALRNSQLLLRRSLMMVNQSLGLPAQAGLPGVDPRELAISQQELALRQASAQSEAQQQRSVLRQSIAEQNSARARRDLNQTSFKRLERLLNDGAISQLQMEREKEKLLDAELNYERAAYRVEQTEQQLRQAQFRANHVAVAEAKELYNRRLNLQRELAELDNQISEQQKRMALHTLKAPVGGTVFDVNVSRGELASAAQPALQLVPNQSLQAKILIPNNEVGLVKVGMPVEVRVDSFPFNEYGSLRGKLLRVGASALPPEPGQLPVERYPATVVLETTSLERKGKRYGLRSGMSINALLKLGTRPVIALVSDQIATFFDSAQRIR
jgi:HlyD family secretion protein